MSVLLLDAEHQLGPRPVVGDLVQVVHVLLILPHRVHLLQHILSPGNIFLFNFFLTWLVKVKDKLNDDLT